jgi:hypothetical protein
VRAGEGDEPLHVVDKFWNPDPLVALVIDPVGLPLWRARRFSCPACPCPHKIDFSRRHGRRSPALLRLSRAGNVGQGRWSSCAAPACE